MRIVLVIGETPFFHPEFVRSFLERTEDQVVGACLVTREPPKNDIEGWLVRHFWYLRVDEMAKLGFRKVKFLLLDKLEAKGSYTVGKVLRDKGIPTREVRDTLNEQGTLDFIAGLEPDVIVSSQGLYFGKKLLALPKICCLNRHSGLLPRNGGLWPGFQAVRKGEKETGTSIHTMTPTIDGGVVLVQLKTPIRPGETLWEIYRRCFAISTDALLEALEKVRNNDFTPVENGYEREYYSFPTAQQWKQFRQRGGRYV